MDLTGKKVMVTGGAGFLGHVVCRELKQRQVGELIIPRRTDFDLTNQSVTDDLIEATRPDVVVHLAAEVGGIGANRANPGRYFYANLAMGLHLVESSRKHGVTKFVQIGTVCSYP